MDHETFIKKEISASKSAVEIFELFHEKPYSMFLDSSLKTNGLGENSIIVFDPFLVFISKGNIIKIITGGHCKELTGDPLAYLQSLFKKYKCNFASDLPFISGGMGYFSYDLCQQLENLQDNREDDLNIPDIIFCFYNNAIVINHKENKTYVAVSSIGSDKAYPLEQKVNQIAEKISESNNYSANTSFTGGLSRNFHSIASNFSKEQYCDMVIKAKEYIRNGDIYQVNLSQRFKTKIDSPNSFNLYKRLRNTNPTPFSAYLNFGDIKVLSSSPERFIRISEGTIETRPIKGTRPRGINIKEDINQYNDLVNSEKDRAELTMIVDLERNDLGKVCEIGSVHVKKLFEVEQYSTVYHLVSTIEGKLLPGVDVTNCIRAAFPGGSITGAPKIRAMEIINGLEPVKRNIYTGSIGYIGFDGNCDLNIAIRTIIVKGTEAFYNVGGGIVWDSLPEKEYQETLDKGKALMQVLSEGM